MFKKTLYLLPLVALGACAYAIDGAIQDVQFVTPGARNASCTVYVEGLKYRVKPPQTLNLFKSEEDLVVDCMAPGNRRKVVYIESAIEPSTAWNATNAGVGLPWDYASKALFKYPDVVEVNFTDTPVTDPLPPAHNSPDIRQPETYILEEFSPSSPVMNKDRDAPPVEILRRKGSMQSSSMQDDGAAFSDSAGSASTGKGNLMNVMEDIGVGTNDSGPSMEPTPLFPGE